MFVHFKSAGQQFDKVVITDGNGNRQTDRRPQGITAADPVPEFKHVGGVNAEFFDFFGIGGQRDKVLCHGVFAQSGHQPVTRGFRIGQGFLRRKGFGRHDKQSRFGIQVF